MRDLRCILGLHDWIYEKTLFGKCARCGELRKVTPEEFERFMEILRGREVR